MPLRNLRYVADIYKELTEGKSVYLPRLIPLPSPRFVVFYNGATEQPEHTTYRLSDAFEKWSREIAPTATASYDSSISKKECIESASDSLNTANPAIAGKTKTTPTNNTLSPTPHQLELIVDVYNINPDNNEDLKRACKLLGDYTLFVESVRSHLKLTDNDVRLALKEAIDECIIKDILKEFLIAHGAEIRDMDWLYEYDEEAHIEMIQKEFYEVGLKEGIDSVILGALAGGSSPEDIAKITHIPLKQVLQVANTLEQ